MEIKVKCKMVNVKHTKNGKYKCTFVTDTHDVITSYAQNLNEDKVKSMAQMDEKMFSIPEDTCFFFREGNKNDVGEGV